MIIVGAIAGFALLLIGALALFKFGARRTYDYEQTATHFSVLVFGRFTVYHIALRTISNVRLWRFSLRDTGSIFTTLRLGNQFLSQAVVIERRIRFPRYIIITPAEPHDFVASFGVSTNHWN